MLQAGVLNALVDLRRDTGAIVGLSLRISLVANTESDSVRGCEALLMGGGMRTGGHWFPPSLHLLLVLLL